MKIIFFGTGAFGLPALESLKTSAHELVCVVTAPDKPQGRHLKLQGSPVKEWAEASRVPVLQYPRLNTPEPLAALKALAPDALVVIAYGALLPPSLLKLPRLAALNVHSSLLPFYRGPAPIHWALLNGDAETGVTVMRMAEKLDTGDIVLQKKIRIAPDDDFNSMETRLAAIGGEALIEALEAIAQKKAGFTPQDENKATYARKIIKEDGHLDWRQPAGSIENRVRALVRWPKAFVFCEAQRLLVLQARATEEKSPSGAAGRILKASAREGLFVAAADRVVEIQTLQAEGKKPLAAKEFLKGFPLAEGRPLE